jgi:hypothetical protein
VWLSTPVLYQEALPASHSALGVLEIDGIILLEHRRRLVAGELHDYRLVNTRLTHISNEGVAQVMKSEVIYLRLPAGIGKSLLDLLEGRPSVSKDPVMPRNRTLPASFNIS